MNAVKGKIIPLKDYIFVKDMEFGEERTASGIIVQNLNGKLEGVKSRWGKVWAVGPKQKDVKIGEWILVAHGRWTRGIKVDDDGQEITIRRIDNNDILIVSDEKPKDIDVGKGI